ncbi:hypothetical protein NWP22_11795 [Anabaenopsis tanganyikae CS-531]|uniref:Uncharacterized protein n=2 Tax=Anabaenopsis TaxID=110103 RepID=A0ABT6KF73_9CYAN|nr:MULTISPECIES: hypothetical protein [Anabaenopsis]MDB9541386.1 hypothetical protein [Anabaenopsis arnoldii]MDH6090365.1 hypothetical protein [Anabaenopsis arnoldii]MDH6106542.1 hypothetical protein [Anabaenopsis tanganyikae CS-531]
MRAITYEDLQARLLTVLKIIGVGVQTVWVETVDLIAHVWGGLSGGDCQEVLYT